MPGACDPWGPDCGDPGAWLWTALCCGRTILLCEVHHVEATAEIWGPDGELRGLHCLVCGEDYGPGTWVAEDAGGFAKGP